MWLVAGLGNPGLRYANTPHNLGFDVVIKLAKRANATWTASRQAKAEVCKTFVGSQDLILVMPTTFMNLSGEAIQPIAHYYKIPPENVLSVSDDIAIPWGRMRFRAGGSHGGHNGLRNMIMHLGTDKFPRLRVGCKPENWKGDMKAYVLAKLRGEALELADHMAEVCADSVEEVLKEGLQSAMTRYNGYDAFKIEG